MLHAEGIAFGCPHERWHLPAAVVQANSCEAYACSDKCARLCAGTAVANGALHRSCCCCCCCCCCVDVDECKDSNGNLHNCHSLAMCNNSNGTFHCVCIGGYTGNGTHCAGRIESCFYHHVLREKAYRTVGWRRTGGQPPSYNMGPSISITQKHAGRPHTKPSTRPDGKLSRKRLELHLATKSVGAFPKKIVVCFWMKPVRCWTECLMFRIQERQRQLQNSH